VHEAGVVVGVPGGHLARVGARVQGAVPGIHQRRELHTTLPLTLK